MAKYNLRPIIPFSDLSSETSLFIKIFSEAGTAFVGASYISPEDKNKYQKELINAIDLLRGKYMKNNDDNTQGKIDMPIVIFTDAN